MTTQIVQLTTFDYGSSLSSVSLRHPTTDDEIATANTAAEVSADSGVYNCVFDKTSVIAAGTYRLRAVVSGQPVNRWVTLTGTDGEIAIARVERAAELDSATLAQLQAIEDNTDASVGYLTTLVGRITTQVYTLFLDLIAMITGSGTADAKFDAAALSLAPSGSSGEGGGLTPEQDETLTAIAVKLAGTPIEVVSRVADGGNIVAYVGDDFRVRSDSSLLIPVSDPAGGLFTKLDAIGADNLAFGAMLDARNRFAGTVANLSQSGSGDSQLLLLEVELSEAGAFCRVSDDYVWQIQSTQEHDGEVDTLIEIEGTLSLRKNVVA
jgi:hypothetical protein